MQLIDLCQEAFDLAGLDELWLHPYRIISSGRTTGEYIKLELSVSDDYIPSTNLANPNLFVLIPAKVLSRWFETPCLSTH